MNSTKWHAPPLDEWIRFLKTGEIQGSDTAQGLPEARERLRIDSLNAEEKHAYIRDMEAIRYQKSVISTGWIEGRAEGREEGRAEEHLKVLQSARFMKSLGISVEDIKNNLGLTDEEINAL
jgi:predicted transposase YdaD